MIDANRKDGVRLPAGQVHNSPGEASCGNSVRVQRYAASDIPDDHFVYREGLRFAGTHLIVDLWNASSLDDLAHVDRTLRQAAEEAGATLLKIDLHSFAPTGGITGVAILAESHISIHTWPERSYAAIDLFMCGETRPHKAIAIMREAFSPGHITVVEHKRGLEP